MTKEEKNEMYRKNLQKHIKGRKTKIISLIVLPVAGVVITLLLSGAGKAKQNEIAEATVLGSMPVGEFLEDNESGSAIYTGKIEAIDPAISLDESGEYISYHHKVVREVTIREKDSDKIETETTTISDDSDSCSKIKMDDVVVPYKCFHSLPLYSTTKAEGAASNQLVTTFSYTPSKVEGTFLLKCKNGEVTSAQYYESADVAGEINRGFGMARTIIWILIVAIEIFLVVDIIKTTKTIKLVGDKIQ